MNMKVCSASHAEYKRITAVMMSEREKGGIYFHKDFFIGGQERDNY